MTPTLHWPKDSENLVFALASCQYPAGLLDRDLSDMTLNRLADMPRAGGSPRFLLLVGDQIYADATAGLFDPGIVDQALEDAYASSTHALGMGRVRDRFVEFSGAMCGIYTMLDDHEICDNWEPQSKSSPEHDSNLVRLHEACASYVKKCRWNSRRPGFLPGYSAGALLWYSETDAWTGHRFFVADSRTMRTLRNASTLDSASILGAEQWTALRAWLAAGSASQVSFVASPAMLLPRRLTTATHPDAALHSDAWDGYPASLNAMLACLCDEAHGPVIFLSGDEHLSCVAKIEIWRHDHPERAVVAHSIHSSACYAPYPFANGREENFARSEKFGFSSGGVAYGCRVDTWFPQPVDSVAVIAISPVGSGSYRMNVDFIAGNAQPDAEPQRWSTTLA